MAKLDFLKVLGVISIIGYLAIFLNAVTDYNFGLLSDSLLFLIIGITLMFAGGVGTGLNYLKDGFQTRDISKLITLFVGAGAVLIGVLENPFIGIELPVFNGIKVIVSLVAIVIITFETFFDDGKVD